MATSASEFGITISWTGELTVGDFVADGKYIVAPAGVSIEDVDPASGSSADFSVVNGAEVNPWPQTIARFEQGWMKKNNGTLDGLQLSSSPGDGERLPYVASKNAAAGVSPSTPLVLNPGDTLVCTITYTQAEMNALNIGAGHAKIKTAAAFTVVASAPAAGTFRPGYAGNVKDLTVNTSQIDWSKLGPGLPLPSDAVALHEGISFVERHVARPWLDLYKTWRSRAAHPFENLARFIHNNTGWRDGGYGRGLATEYGDVVATLIATDFTQVQKQTLMYGAIQVGLDLFSVTQHDTGTSTSTTSTTLVCTGKTWAVDQWKGAWVWTKHGAAPAGRCGIVQSNTADTLVVDKWTTIDDGDRSGSASTPASSNFFRVGCDYGIWQGDGGHSSGRFMPILFAGHMLGRSDMVNLVKDSDRYFDNGGESVGICFGELHQTYVVQETSPGVYNYNSPGNQAIHDDPAAAAAHTYSAADEGMYEWGHAHGDPAIPRHGNKGVNGPLWNSLNSGSGTNPPNGDSRALNGKVEGFDADVYRGCCTVNSWVGTALAVLAIPGLKALLNHDAFTGYVDRLLDGQAGMHPNNGQAIADSHPDWNQSGGIFQSWFGRGGRSVSSGAGFVAYDTWHRTFWQEQRANLPLLANATSIVQSKTDGGEVGNYNFGTHNLLVTLDSATVNGNILVAVFMRSNAAGDAGDPLIISPDVADWTVDVNQAITAQAGAHVFVAHRKVVAGENSIDVDWDNGSGLPENCSMTLFEISSPTGELTVAAETIHDPAGTGTTVALDAVSALDADLLIAAAAFHDDDGTSPAWSNDFVQISEQVLTGGEPDMSVRIAWKIALADGSEATTLSFGTPPAADQRHGVIFAIRAAAMLSPDSISSAEAFGTPTVEKVIEDVVSIGSAEAFGSPTLGHVPKPSSIPSAEAFGSPQLDEVHFPSSIPSAEAFGSPQLDEVHFPDSIASSEAFGSPTIQRVLQPDGIPSAEAFGRPVLSGGVPPTAPTKSVTMNRRTSLRIDR